MTAFYILQLNDRTGAFSHNRGALESWDLLYDSSASNNSATRDESIFMLLKAQVERNIFMRKNSETPCITYSAKLWQVYTMQFYIIAMGNQISEK